MSSPDKEVKFEKRLPKKSDFLSVISSIDFSGDFLSVPSIEIDDYSWIRPNGSTHSIDKLPEDALDSSSSNVRPPGRNVRSASCYMEADQAQFLKQQLSNMETTRKLSSISHTGDTTWSQAVHNLNDALSVVPAQRKNSLQLLLNEVGKNENVTAGELIEKLRTAPKPSAKRRTSLADWSPLRTLRKVNRTDNLSVCVEETPSIFGQNFGSENQNFQTSENENGATSPVPISISPQWSPTFLRKKIQRATPNLFFASSVDSTIHESDQDQDNQEEVFTFDTKMEAEKTDIPEKPIENKKEDQEVTQLLENVAEGIASSGPSFDNLIHVLQNQRIQDNLNSVVDYALQKLQEQWEYIFDILVPMEKIQTMIFVCLIQTITLQQALTAVPILACYISFGVMIYSTLKLFHSKYWAKEAEKWHRLLNIFIAPVYGSSNSQEHGTDEDGNASFYSPQPQFLFTKPNFRRLDTWTIFGPFIHFFAALTIFVFSTSMANEHIPNALSLSALSLTFALLCCLTLNDQSRKLSLFCVFLTFLASSTNLILKLNVAQNSWISSIVNVNSFSTLIGSSIKFSINVPAISIGAVGFVHVILLYRCYVKKMSLIEEVVLPHVVCLTWWKTAIELFLLAQDGIEWQNIALTVGMLWLTFFPTGAAFGLVILLIFTQLKHSINLITFLKAAFTLSILFLPFFYDKIRQYLSTHSWFPSFLSNRNERFTRGKAFLLYAILVFSSVIILYQGHFHASHEKIDLSWQQFDEQCGEEAIKKLNVENALQIQIECAEFRGAIVEWEGSIKNIKITTIDNFFDNLFSYLPYGFAQRLRCFYGDELKLESKLKISNYKNNRCSLSSSNVYTFKIDVEPVVKINSNRFGCPKNAGANIFIPHKNQSAKEICANEEIDIGRTSKSKIRLTASHGYKELITTLRTGDLVKFTASFDEQLALKYPTKMILHKLECLKCRNDKDNISITDGLYDEGFWENFHNACCFAFNFIFAPLFIAQ